MDENGPLAGDKLDLIFNWVSVEQEALEGENISYGELALIDAVYDLITVAESNKKE